MLNLFQHPVESTPDETLKRVQGDRNECDTVSEGRGILGKIPNMFGWIFLLFGLPARSPALRDEGGCMSFGARAAQRTGGKTSYFISGG
jgi:hypothetical protein